jgi:hypothetical protein
MQTNEMLPILGLFTLVAALAFAIYVFARFMRKPGNRHPMDTPRGQAVQQMRDEDVVEARKEGNLPPSA